VSFVLIRHASAGERAAWLGDDGLRPLDEHGREQARMLAERLVEHGITRILSSPAVRCVDTVAPLAGALGLNVEIEAALAEGALREDALRLLLQSRDGAAFCTHGDVLAELLGAEGQKGTARIAELEGERLSVLEEVQT